MKFEVMSRGKARAFSYRPDIPDCIIVSITDCFARLNQFYPNPHIKGVLRLQFDDVDFGEENCITEKEGQKIVEFVNRFRDQVQEIVVHCEAGVSRSAGVCAALMKIIDGDDRPIFNNPRFCPNMACYRTVMESYYSSYNQEEADEKIAHNIE